MSASEAVAVTGHPDASVRRRATIIGSVAILLWAGAALLTAQARSLPVFQYTTMVLTTGFIIILAWCLVTGRSIAVQIRQPLAVWAVGIIGLFGYRILYFLAFKLAPVVEANLLNYLWPLLIVLFSSFLPGERLKARHLIGTAMGLTGTTVLFARDGRLEFTADHFIGYAVAVGAAITWAAYSVLSRRLSVVPTGTIGGFYAVTAILSAICHVIFEEFVWPQDGWTWLAIGVLGIGPVGIAYAVWDYGMKHGDIQMLGSLSYATPLLSTLLLLVTGTGEFHWFIVASCVLIVSSAIVAGHGIMWRKTR